MALDEVAVERCARGHGQLEVDLVARLEGAEVGAAEGFGHDVGVEDGPFLLDHGQAGAVDGDAAPDLQVSRHGRVVDADAALFGLDDLRDGANDPGEHLGMR